MRLRACLRVLVPGLLACAVLGVGGCRSAALPPPLPADPLPMTLEVGLDPLSAEEIDRFQPDIRLGARWQDGMVGVVVENRSGKALVVSHLNFGVILPGTAAVIGMEPGKTQSFFPRALLQPGESATGKLKFGELGDLTGARCVFQHPGVRPSRCTIQAAPGSGVPASAAPPQPAPPAAAAPKGRGSD